MTQFDVLETMEWAEEHFGSLATNRQCRRRDVMKLVNAGLAISAGLVALCDDDGWTIEPERYGEGFKMTDAGKERLITLRAAAARAEGGRA